LSLEVNFWLGAGSDYSSGTLSTTWTANTSANRAVGQVNLADNTANEWYVTGVQLEAGQTASEFEFLPVDCNLQRCQRYYEKAEDEALVVDNPSKVQYTPFGFSVTKRTNPSVSIVGYTGGGTLNVVATRPEGFFTQHVTGAESGIGFTANAEL
jgi:hypothetical protein